MADGVNGFGSAGNVEQVESKTIGVVINEQHFDIIITEYRNRHLVIITNTERFGTVVSVTRGVAQDITSGGGEGSVYDVRTLSGVEKDYHLAARFLAEAIHITKPIVFVFCLTVQGHSILKNIADVLVEHKSW